MGGLFGGPVTRWDRAGGLLVTGTHGGHMAAAAWKYMAQYNSMITN